MSNLSASRVSKYVLIALGFLSAGVPPARAAPGSPLSALVSRPANSTCLAGPPPSVGGYARLDQVFTQTQGLKSFDFRFSPANSARWYFIARAGKLYTFAGSETPELALDATSWVGV